MLASVEVRRKWVLRVEDWAEIRRLHRAERMPIKVIARVLGCSNVDGARKLDGFGVRRVVGLVSLGTVVRL
jgi:transposase